MKLKLKFWSYILNLLTWSAIVNFIHVILHLVSNSGISYHVHSGVGEVLLWELGIETWEKKG